MTTELHPLGFFLPENTRLLMLGSFPPPKARWSMDFYYPNIQNDMWRILGLIFYGNKDAFLRDKKAFSEEKAKAFCREKGIGIGDTAMEVIRLKANASDKFLEVVRPIDPEKAPAVTCSMAENIWEIARIFRYALPATSVCGSLINTLNISLLKNKKARQAIKAIPPASFNV